MHCCCDGLTQCVRIGLTLRVRVGLTQCVRIGLTLRVRVGLTLCASD